MLKNFKKLISFVLVLALSVTVCVPSFAAEKATTSQSENEIVLQRKTGTETIKLPAGMSEAELSKLKNDIQKYGDQRLSQEEVARINAKAGASGLVYGPWFGGVDKYYSASVTESIGILAGLYSMMSTVGGALGLATNKAMDIATAIYATIGSPLGLIQKGQWVKADVVKRYREVKYSDGSFAYFQTGFWANNLNMANKSYGSPYTIFSGELD